MTSASSDILVVALVDC